MQTFPLISNRRAQDILVLLPPCALFCGLVIFGALLGRSLFSSVYEAEFAALLSNLPNMQQPGQGMGRVLLYAVTPPLAYCGLMYISGYYRSLLPLWMLTATAQGTAWGMQLGAANVLMKASQGVTAWLTLLLPMLALLPLHGYVAIAAYFRGKATDGPLTKSQRLSPLVRAVAALVVLTALTTLQATLTLLYGLNVLFQ